MSKLTYKVVGPVHIVWVGVDDPLQSATSWAIWPEPFDTRKQAVAVVKQWIAEDRSEGEESEYLQ